MNNNYIKLTFMEYLLFPKNCAKHFIYIHTYIYIYIYTHTHTHIYISDELICKGKSHICREQTYGYQRGVC